jgi:hypothetical protein
MFFLVYLSLVAVIITLRRQERRHHAELALLYKQLGKMPPLKKPKLQKHESWLALPIGLFISIFGVLSIYTNVNLNQVGIKATAEEWAFSCLVLPAGIAIYVLGVRSLQANKRYELMMKERQTA